MTDADAVTDVVARYEAAFNTNDARAMNDLFTAAPIFVNIAGNVVRGQEPLYRAQAFVFDAGGPLHEVYVRYTVESLEQLSGSVAVVHARQHAANPDGTLRSVDDERGESVLMLVLVREAGAWRIRVGQNTAVA